VAVADDLGNQESPGAEDVSELEAQRALYMDEWNTIAEKEKEFEDKRLERKKQKLLIEQFKFDLQAEEDTRIRNRKRKEQELEMKRDTAKQNLKADKEAWERVTAAGYKDTCPVCAQTLPPNEVEDNKEIFERQKKTVEENGNKHKRELAAVEQEIEDFVNAVQTVSEEERRLNEQIKVEQAKLELMPEIEHKPVDVSELRTNIDNIGRKIATYERAKKDQDRLMTMLKEIEGIAREIEIEERKVKDAGQWKMYTAKVTVELVNAQFDEVRIELFKYQKNGNVADTFEIWYKGTKYQDISSTERILAGLEINEYLKNALGVSVPTIIDNFESYSSIKPDRLPPQSIIAVAENVAFEVKTF